MIRLVKAITTLFADCFVAGQLAFVHRRNPFALCTANNYSTESEIIASDLDLSPGISSKNW